LPEKGVTMSADNAFPKEDVLGESHASPPAVNGSAQEGKSSGRRKPKKGAPLPSETLGLVTLLELGEKLGLPLKWLRRQTVEGHLPCIRIGTRILYSVEAVAKYLRERASHKNQHGEWAR
jgi:hypothetical protein